MTNNPVDTDSFFADNTDVTDDVGVVCDFNTLELIHESGKGHCVLYRSTYRGRHVAVKALRAPYRDNRSYTALLVKECSLQAALSHPGIVPLLCDHPVDIADIGPAIIMEYVEGMTLDRFIEHNAPLSRHECDILIARLCDIVAHVHAHGITHRDIKPSNILIPDGTLYPRLIDFGLSHSPSFTTPDYPGGTPGYSAPECLAGAEETGPAADIYSLGRIISLIDTRHRKSVSRVTARCCDADPAMRPAEATDIPAMIRRERRRLQLITAGAASLLGCLILSISLMSVTHSLSPGPAPETAAVTPSVYADVDTESGATAEPAEKITEIAGGTPTDSPSDNLYADLHARSTQCAADRFARHLTLIDTLTCESSARLAVIKHWRWQARQDVSRWLKTRIDSGTKLFETLMDAAYRTIVAYGEEHAGEETLRWRSPSRVSPEITGATTRYSEPMPDGRVYIETLNEDGSVTRTVRNEHPHTYYTNGKDWEDE